MSDRPIPELANDLAAAVVLGDLDAGARVEIRALLKALGSALQAIEEPALARLALEVHALLEASPAEADLTTALALAGTLASEASRLPSRPAASASSPAGRDAETIEFLSDFAAEAEEWLGRADRHLIDGEKGGFDAARIRELFRIFHSIKGLASHLADCRAMAALAHQAESLLEGARDGRLALQGERLELVFAAVEELRAAVGRVRGAVQSGGAVEPGGCERLAQRLAEALEAPAAPEVPSLAEPVPAAPVQPEATPVTPGQGAAHDTLRVSLGRVDAMVELVGELVVVEAMMAHLPELAAQSSPRLRDQLAQLRRITRDLQASAMHLRMLPVRVVFARMHRLVRDLARRSGKRVELELSGEATEMDRGLVEALEEPLVHLVRNALDHGVESPEARAAAGKPDVATLRLSATHRGGRIVIELSDDGAGFDRRAILARARALGLVGAAEEPGEAEIDRLVFASGFSTAERVTEISGRGVGLDIVRRRIEALRGRVAVSSRPGEGSCFRLELPLTLAIIDGMLVACGGERYIVPSASILEAVHVREGMLGTMAGREEFLRVRDEVLPVARLGRMLGAPEGAAERPVALLVESAGRRMALVVDGVLAEQQVVIKPLTEGLAAAHYLSGAAVLSDGRAGLILNIDRVCSELAQAAAAPKEVA